MARCLLVYQRKDKYFRIPDAEVEDWDEVREQLDVEPRLGEPSEIGETVAWLCSDHASYVTGLPMPVDGGFMAQ